MEHKNKLRATASCEGGRVHTESLVNRFSNLPLEVAHHILSFLDIEELTRFSCGSKGCRELSLSSPSLNFCFSSVDTSTCELRVKLLNSLDRFMFHRRDNKIQSFYLFWDGHYIEEGNDEPCYLCSNENFRIITWIHNAVRCNVEVLCLDILLCDFEEEGLAFPSCVFLSTSLRSLNVVQMKGIIIKTPPFAFSSNLSCLELGELDIEDEAFFKWISCSCKCIKQLTFAGVRNIKSITIESPSLEIFNFCDPYGSQICHLKISGEKLESIRIDWGFFLSGDHSLNIFAPNLNFLRWVGNVMNHPNLGELECLEEAYILLDPKVDEFENVFEALCSVRRVGVLGLNEATVKALYGEGSIPAQFNDIWCLTLNTRSISDDLIPSMVSLLRGMPNLCTLHIKNDSLIYTRKSDDVQVQASGFDMEYWKLQNLNFIYQLEEVTIKLTKGSNGIEFARYILEHAEALEKMNIICSPKQSDVIKKLNESKIISDATLTFQEK
ncbi:hypothetical protein CerSpe_248730 [Prunus speciosa]